MGPTPTPAIQSSPIVEAIFNTQRYSFWVDVEEIKRFEPGLRIMVGTSQEKKSKNQKVHSDKIKTKIFVFLLGVHVVEKDQK